MQVKLIILLRFISLSAITSVFIFSLNSPLIFPLPLLCLHPLFALFSSMPVTSSSPVLSLSLTLHLSFFSFSFLSHSPPNRQFSSSSTVGHPVLSGRATAPLTWWSTSSPGRGGPVLSLALADRAETHTLTLWSQTRW